MIEICRADDSTVDEDPAGYEPDWQNTTPAEAERYLNRPPRRPGR